ncbi:MAG: 3-phosphoshikimate 1-carboxyvinyltransferase [Actinomyces sp.]|nr:3-phosphoshikimate 1-carboxyvinyltransferase [Actinomyces sp.]MCI1640923.1 3-phosphoshikimate 1-carboxyvinyltransferase [Actinomyces sp.]MCI1661291.1 3-phosphoshikimate 1-carboxyvinyltransferase [Actinomyces sp.]MCI1690299.1 3-phosphoshikimate 1-carboxyvinyltransferase [Actinomyces sp.]MCI1786940.1 3-phosphoshikimate 1-carboxyvinyltransferase [Actinomyces sp.]MCI1829494.1 3-phosphoshikimate 1-carboxyvinyltransferase [Actinomyces sp.]
MTEAPPSSPDDASGTWWPAPVSPGPVDACVPVPGSKSQTNRALVLAALADGPVTLRGALDARDTRLMADGLRTLGARVERSDGALRVTPLDRVRPGGLIDCGLAGTVLRFLPPLAALARGETTFTGDEAARARPVRPVLDALEQAGASVSYLGEPGFLPFRVRGSGVLPVPGAPHDLAVDAQASSQFLSALLLAAPLMSGPVTVRSAGRIVSAPHIAMTVAALRDRGVPVSELPGDTGTRAWRIRPGRPRGGEIAIEPDLSNAGPFLAAAALTGGRVRVPDWPRGTTQAGDAWRGLLARMGARVALDGTGLTVEGPGASGLRGVDVDLSDVGELTPTLAALAVCAATPSRISGVAHLRGHETDRLAALAREITRLGGDVTELEDGLAIRPRPLHGARVRTYADHRMATFAAVVGLRVPGVEVEDVATTGKTLPGFTRLWARMLGGGAG